MGDMKQIKELISFSKDLQKLKDFQLMALNKMIQDEIWRRHSRQIQKSVLEKVEKL